jgi:hypothetical protein
MYLQLSYNWKLLRRLIALRINHILEEFPKQDLTKQELEEIEQFSTNLIQILHSFVE